jgi:hypothetical protein
VRKARETAVDTVRRAKSRIRKRSGKTRHWQSTSLARRVKIELKKQMLGIERHCPREAARAMPSRGRIYRPAALRLLCERGQFAATARSRRGDPIMPIVRGPIRLTSSALPQVLPRQKICSIIQRKNLHNSLVSLVSAMGFEPMTS